MTNKTPKNQKNKIKTGSLDDCMCSISAPMDFQGSPLCHFRRVLSAYTAWPPKQTIPNACTKGLGLNLMIPLDCLLVSWWYSLVTSRGAPLVWHCGTVRRMWSSPIPFRCGLRASINSLLLLRTRWMMRMMMMVLIRRIDIIISNNPAPTRLATIVVVGNFLVVGLRIGGDYVPGMKKAGEKTKNA